MSRAALLAAAAAAVAAIPTLASAADVMAVGRFDALELHGGGNITIRQAPVQRVTVIRATSDRPRVEVIDGGKLILAPCRGSCWAPNHFEVLVETPVMNSVAIKGGGKIVSEGAFAQQGAVSAVIHGGGVIDLKTMPAGAASASIHGGGKIFLAAQDSLSASIAGGGSIHYLGHPSVSTSIHGGGSVDPIR